MALCSSLNKTVIVSVSLSQDSSTTESSCISDCDWFVPYFHVYAVQFIMAVQAMMISKL